MLVMQTIGMAERLEEILRDYDSTASPDSIVVGSLSGGFEMPSLDLTVYIESDIFGETTEAAENVRRTQPVRRKSALGAFISDFRDLKAGDYVVHVDHGIGRFEGLQTLESGGIQREFMLLMYAENSKLFVPVERLDLVSRYSSGESAAGRARSARRHRLAKDKGKGKTCDARYGGRAFAALCRAKAGAGLCFFAGRSVAA